MKRALLAGVTICAMMIGMTVTANATLIVDGRVNYAGADRQLIYDTDLNITWLDYTSEGMNWAPQKAWADNLSLTINGIVFDDWRLPVTLNTGISPVNPMDFTGTYSQGYNNSSSELGHLYYTELGGKGLFDASGSWQADYGLANTGPFENLLWGTSYWSETEYPYGNEGTWCLLMVNGAQMLVSKEGSGYRSGLAVISGSTVAEPVPEPSTFILFATGLAGFGFWRKKKRL